MRRWCGGAMTRLLAWVCLCLCALGASAAEPRAGDDLLVKAAYLYNFAKFTTWPEGALGAQLTLCIAGEDALAEVLDPLRDKRVKGRPIVVQRLQGARPGAACHLLYIAASEQQHYASLIKPLRRQPTLTISEIANFAANGGIIELGRVGDRPRFVINLGAAREAGLDLSPSLLSLAEVIGQE